MLLIILLLYFNPYNFIIVILALYMEYFFFLNFILQFISYKKTPAYNMISIKKINESELSSWELWLEISRINGFVRLYTLCVKKKINVRNLIIAAAVYFLSIPMRLIMMACEFVVCWSKNTNNTLTTLYLYNYDRVKNLKIEFKDKHVYLNCKSTKDLITLVLRHNPGAAPEECLKIIKNLRNHMTELKKYESTEKERVEFCLAKITNGDGTEIPLKHFCYQTSLKALDDEKVLFHATSNTNVKLCDNQKVALPLPELIKPGSAAPGTILTEGKYTIVKYAAIKHVSWWGLEYLKFTQKHRINFEIDETQYFNDKEVILSQIIGKKDRVDEIDEIGLGLFDFPVFYSSDETILHEISLINNSLKNIEEKDKIDL